VKARWELKTLGAVCAKITDGSHNPPKGIEDSEFFMLSSKNILDGRITLTKPRYLAESDFLQENKRTDVSEGDVLLTVVGTIGRTAIVPAGFPKITLQRSVGVLKPQKDVIVPRYLMFALQSILKTLMSGARGVAQKGIYLKALREIKIPLPPLEEQKRIVTILDEAFEGLDRARAHTEANLQNAKDLLQSKKASVFDLIKQNEMTVPLESVCTEIFAGGDAPKENLSKEKTEKYNIPIIANAVKNNGLYGYTDLVRVTEPSVTVAARGSGTGHTEIRRQPFYPIVRLIVLTPDTEKMNVDFFKYAIQDLDILRSGSAIPQLTVPMIKGYSIPILSLPAQKQAVKILDKSADFCTCLQDVYYQKLADLEDLRQSLLQKAFAGELT